MSIKANKIFLKIKNKTSFNGEINRNYLIVTPLLSDQYLHLISQIKLWMKFRLAPEY